MAFKQLGFTRVMYTEKDKRLDIVLINIPVSANL